MVFVGKQFVNKTSLHAPEAVPEPLASSSTPYPPSSAPSPVPGSYGLPGTGNCLYGDILIAGLDDDVTLFAKRFQIFA